MANGVLGLGSGQASALNSDLIDKLKTAERKSTVAPFETKIENIATEKKTFSSISTKVSELLASIKPFDLFVSGGVTAFDQKTASTSGDSVTFDAVDIKTLKQGSTTVNVSKLAQKDVYQSVNSMPSYSKDETKSLKIQVGSAADKAVNYKFSDYNSYEELVSAINTQSGIDASLEKVGINETRLVLKSESTGADNQLTITDNTAIFGFTDDKGLSTPKSHVLEAKNMEAIVDGVSYTSSTNTITVDGLKITANKADSIDSGTPPKFTSNSTINITEDNTQLETQMNSFITKYNELVALVDTEVQSSDSKLGDKSSIRSIISTIKDKLFGSNGSGGKSVFNYGIELDKYGGLTLDSTKFNSAVQNDKSGLKDLFAGTAEKKGLGTTLKETLDTMTFTGGLIDIYQKGITTRETSLNTEKTKAEDILNKKYELMSAQFAAYGTIINQMESSFSGLKMMIQQSTTSN